MPPKTENNARPWGSPLLLALRADPSLLAWTLLLSVVTLLPLFLTPVLPLTDLANHTAMAAQIGPLLSGDEVAARHFMLQPHPAPYWVVYVFLFSLSSFLSPLVAAKVVVGISLLVVPLGMMRLLLALGRNVRLGLWAFAACWDLSLTMGFVAFTFTTGVSFFFIARALESLRPRGSPLPRLGATIALGLFLAVSHAHAAGTACALLGIVALTELPDRKRFFRLAALAAVPMLGLVPWMLLGASSASPPSELDLPDRFGYWPNIGYRVQHMFEYTMDVTSFVFGRTAAGFAYLTLLIGPLLLAIFPQKNRQALKRGFALYGGAWLLFLAMPMSLYQPFFQIFINERHATLVLLMGLTLPPKNFSRHTTSVLSPGVAAAVLMGVAVTMQAYMFEKHVRPLGTLMQAVEPNSRINWVLWEHETPESKRQTLTTVLAYLIAQKGGYSPLLFQTPNLPVVYDEEEHLPHVRWTEPEEFHVIEHGKDYDYVIAQGIDYDRINPVAAGEYEIVPHVQAGTWRLYSVERRNTPP